MKRKGPPFCLSNQNARMALDISSHGYIMENGRIVLDDTTEKLKKQPKTSRCFISV